MNGPHVRNIKCLYCGAPPGHSCVTPGGHTTTHHTIRILNADDPQQGGTVSIDMQLRALKAERAAHSAAIDRLGVRLADIACEIDDLEERQAAMPDLSQYPIGSIIVFDHVFRMDSDPSRVYTYAIIKSHNGAWYTSGPKSPGPYNDQDMAFFIMNGNPNGCYWEVDSMQQVLL